MCLILLAFHYDKRFPLVLAANRDEFFTRPTREAGFWQDSAGGEDVLGGQDRVQGGTWLGIHRNGRFAAVTNIRDPSVSRQANRSRGQLTRDFLLGRESATDFLDALLGQLEEFAGFNLILGDWDNLFYLNSDEAAVQQLSPGVYGLSNGRLDDPWPKVRNGKRSLEHLLQLHHPLTTEQLLKLMLNQDVAPDAELPDTGVPLALERRLSASFIVNEDRAYGTRCSTTMIADQRGQLRFCEQNYDADSRIAGRHYFEFSLK